MYTGQEREIPGEQVQSEFLFKKDSSKGYEPQEVRNPRPGYNFDQDHTGGVMPVDNITRTTIDKVAKEYDIDLQYGEGRVRIRGNRDEIVKFVEEICGSEHLMPDKNHPNEPFNLDEYSGETDRHEEEICTDGGREYGMPSAGFPTHVDKSEPDNSGAGNLT